MCSPQVDGASQRAMVEGLLAPVGDAGKELVVLADLLDTVRGVLVERLGVFERADGHAGDGALTAATWLAARTDIPLRDCRIVARTAGLLHDHLPATAAAVAEGRISQAKADILTRVAGPRTRDCLTADVERVLLDAVEALPVDDAKVVIDLWVRRADTNGPDPGDPTRNRVRMEQTLGGRWDLTGSLDPVSGHTVKTVLDAIAAELAASGTWDDESDITDARKRADALVGLAHRANGADQANPVHVDAVVTIPLAALTNPDNGIGDACELYGAGPIDTATAIRLALYGTISALIVDEHRQPLDLYRSTRLATRWQRLAMTIGGHGRCVTPGCPNKRTHAHHLTEWDHGGNSNLDNYAPTCPAHHQRTIHAGGFTLHRSDHGTWTLQRPDGTTINPDTWPTRHPPPPT